LQREWGALSDEEEGRGILPRTVNKQAGLGWRGSCGSVSCKQTYRLAGAATHAQQSGVRKLEKAVKGGKFHRRGGKTHFPHEL
jgi:hypothetical protein